MRARLRLWNGFVCAQPPLERAGVYKITDCDGKAYVGASKNVAARLKAHAQRFPGAYAEVLFYLTSGALRDLEDVEAALIDAHQGRAGWNQRRLTSRAMHEDAAHSRRMATMKATMATEEFRARRSAASKAMHARPEVKAKHRASSQRVNGDPVTKEKIAASKRGRIWITNGITSRAVYPDTLLPAGWRPGRK